MSQVYLVDTGGGVPLFCLHGIGSSHESLRFQTDGLRDVARVIAWDAPGYGASPDPETPPGLDGYAATAISELEALGGAHLLGVSWGAVIALRIALSRPDLLRSLILISASRGGGRSPETRARLLEQAAQLEALGVECFSRRRVSKLLAPHAPSQLAEDVCAAMARAVRLPGYRYAVESMAETDLTDQLASIRIPTLVLCGQEDGVTGMSESQAIAEAVSNAVLVSIDGAGHLVNQERPESVNAWIASYLEITNHLVGVSHP